MTTVETRMNLEAIGRGRVRDEIDYNLISDERAPPPVRRDVAEHSVLDLVPLARARRKVADGDSQPRLVGEALQLHLPQPHVRECGTAYRIRRNQFA